MGPHIWLQDALSRLLDEEAWSKEVMAGSGGFLGVEPAVKVNKPLLLALGVPQQVIFLCVKHYLAAHFGRSNI